MEVGRISKILGAIAKICRIFDDFSKEEEAQHLIAAWMLGRDEVQYDARGLRYEINFRRMVQMNLSTGQKRHIRVKPRADREAVHRQDVKVTCPQPSGAKKRFTLAKAQPAQPGREALADADALVLPNGVHWPLGAKEAAQELYRDLCLGP